MFGDLQTRLRLCLTVAITAALTYLLVWKTVQPNVLGDPVSFIFTGAWLLSWASLIVVAAVATLLSVLICRRRLPNLPVLVFAAGLCVLSFCSGPAVRAHWRIGTYGSYLGFALEILLLTALLYAVHLTGKMLLARFAGQDSKTHPSVPNVSLAKALQTPALAGIVAFIVALLFATTTWAEIAPANYKVYGCERGQIIFAALAAGFLSALAAHQVFHPVKAVFCWLALPLLGLLAYLALAKFSAPASEPLPVNPLGNFLPIDFVGPGVLGSMLGLLSSRKLFRERQTQES